MGEAKRRRKYHQRPLDNEPDTFRLPPDACPWCGAAQDAASAMVGKIRAPMPGDMGVCISCSQVTFYNDDLSMRRATARERFAAIRAQPDLGPTLDLMQRVVRMLDEG